VDYIKPEVVTLGDAKLVIAHLRIKPPCHAIDPHPQRTFFNPAYDLDD
jgi:hypothetical protein